MALTNLKLCMSAYSVCSLLEISCCLVPTVSFSFKNQEQIFTQTQGGKAVCIRWNTFKA